MIGNIGMFVLAWIGLSFLVGGLYALVNYLDTRRRERSRPFLRCLFSSSPCPGTEVCEHVVQACAEREFSKRSPTNE